MTRKAQIKKITIVWHEGTGEFDGKVFNSWQGLQYALNKIYNDYKTDGGGGYDKVKIVFEWSNGKTLTDRVDVGDSGGDFTVDGTERVWTLTTPGAAKDRPYLLGNPHHKNPQVQV